MTTTVFLAVIAAAVLHAAWNALVKSGDDKRVNMGAVVIGHLPPALAIAPFVPFPALESLPYLLAGIALHLGYQFFLMHAYQSGDLTQVYPIARGSAPLLVTLFSVAVLGVPLAWPEIAAVAVIAAGILSLALHRRGQGLANRRAAILALGTGCFIAGYSLVDGLGARLAGTALGFYVWLTFGNILVMVTYLALRAPTALRDIAIRARGVVVFGGGASFAAYALVIWSFTQAPIALVTALRETSIVFALLIGVLFLRERFDLTKLIASLFALFGVALLRLSGG